MQNTSRPQRLQDRLNQIGNRHDTPFETAPAQPSPRPEYRVPPLAQPQARQSTSLRALPSLASGSLNALATLGMAILVGTGGNAKNLENIPLVQVKAEKLPSIRHHLQNPGPIINVCKYTPGFVRRTAVGLVTPEAKILSDTLCEAAKRTPKPNIKALTRAGDAVLEDGRLTWKEMNHLRAIAVENKVTVNCAVFQPELDDVPTKSGTGEIGKAIALNVAGCITKTESAARIGISLFKRDTSPTR